ncbi:hypothetical protein SAMN05443244_0939 [Terriglobus roseus]|uniref:Uncharacterized protein n=1 Tax=Terriglobus roseus TaxID=392734 RepID=A0A1H4K131_9BACT|nr:hypothetical protein SAMN05443244_0939 [Terriglobus roseus]
MAFLITCQLSAPQAHEYSALHAELLSINAVNILEAAWIVSSREHSSNDIFNCLVQCLHPGDRLFICEFSGLIAWENLQASDDEMFGLSLVDHLEDHQLNGFVHPWRRNNFRKRNGSTNT